MKAAGIVPDDPAAEEISDTAHDEQQNLEPGEARSMDDGRMVRLPDVRAGRPGPAYRISAALFTGSGESRP